MSAMTRFTTFVLLSSAVLAAQPPADRDIVAKIRAEAMAHSQVAPIFDYLTVAIGPRLTASPAHKRAAEWTRDRLAAYGLSNPHLEPWTFGRGWTLDKLTIDPDMDLNVSFNRMVNFFRGFTAKPMPMQSGDIYKDLVD